MDNTYLVLAILFLMCLVIRSGYEILKDTHRVNPHNKTVFGLVFAAMCALWASWFSLCPIDPLPIDMPSGFRWIGLVLFAAGMILALGALFQLKGLENIDHLVTNGFFRRIRHPMYTGFVLWILGWGLFHSAVASLLLGLAGIANILYWRRLEDTRLQLQYGDAYLSYRRSTWF